jgi:hypothetical protein
LAGLGEDRLAMVLRARLALLVGLLALPVQPAQAQGSVQPIFGYGQPPRAYRHPPLPYYRHPAYGGPFSPYRFEEERSVPRSSTYRTLCVRLCDGYYFPISSSATQDTLAHDADVCSASCGSEARLFFHPSLRGDAASAVDLTGMTYGSLANAFKYRKTLVEGCRCRPQPWSQSEAERHRGYATARSGGDAVVSQDAGPKDAEVIAGDYSRRSVVPNLSVAEADGAPARPAATARNIEPILAERLLLGMGGGWGSSRFPYGSPYDRRY